MFRCEIYSLSSSHFKFNAAVSPDSGAHPQPPISAKRTSTAGGKGKKGGKGKGGGPSVGHHAFFPQLSSRDDSSKHAGFAESVFFLTKCLEDAEGHLEICLAST